MPRRSRLSSSRTGDTDSRRGSGASSGARGGTLAWGRISAPSAPTCASGSSAKGRCSRRTSSTTGEAGGWWEWKPQKTALEYLWQTGELAIARRVHFQKVYDLTEHVLWEATRLPAPALEEHVDWACRTALDRLGIATAGEIAAFWSVTDLAAAKQWCERKRGQGEIVAVLVEPEDGGRPQLAAAPANWQRRLRRVPDPPQRLRVLAPFDPVVRDRRRTRLLFGFDFRFEAFVPASERRHGYYVMPILEGDRLVGRIDPEPRRDDGAVRARRVWWESGVRATRDRRRGLDDALARLSECLQEGT